MKQHRQLYILFILLLLLPCSAHAYDWTLMSPVPTTNQLNAIWGTSDTDVFVVGAAGTILHFDGSTWTAMDSGTTNQLNAVWGSSGNDVFAAGDAGTIVHYDGSAWSTMNSGTIYYIADIWGNNGNDVFALAYKTVTSPTNPTINYIILHYDGSSWSNSASGSLVNYLFPSFWGYSGTTCFFTGLMPTTGYQSLVRINGGTRTYLATEQPSVPISLWSGIWGTSENNLFIVGQNGNIRRYNGSSLSSMASGTTKSLNGVWGSSGSDVFAVGSSGTIVHYNGSAWSLMSTGVSNSLKAAWGNSPDDVFSVGDSGTILRYGGSSSNSTTSSFITTTTIPLVTSSTTSTVEVTTTTTMPSTSIAPSTTTSISVLCEWNVMTPALTTNNLTAVWGSSSADEFAVGSSGTILHYAGNSWSVMSSGTTNHLYAVRGFSGSDVFAAGASGTILHYDGSTWSPMNSGTSYNIQGIWGSSGTDVYALATVQSASYPPMNTSYIILHYDGSVWSNAAGGTLINFALDGVLGYSGTTCFIVGSDVTSSLNPVNKLIRITGSSFTTLASQNAFNSPVVFWTNLWGSSENDLFIVGTSGGIRYYNGSSLSSMVSGTTSQLNAVWGSSGSDVFAVGANGTIVHFNGSTWSPMSTGITNSLGPVWGSSGIDVFAAGASGTMLYYTCPATSTTTTVPPTLIELSSFTATPANRAAILTWQTESETNNAGFNIYRAEAEDGDYVKINASLIPAKGSTTAGAAYEFFDKGVKNRKTYWYKLEDIDLNGTATLHGPVSAVPRLIFGFK